MKRMSEDERREILLGLFSGRYYPLDTKEKLRLCPQPFLLVGLREMPEEEIMQIGMVLGDMNKCGPRTVNGMPTFLEVRLIHKDDWKRIVEVYNREVKRLERIKV